MKANAASHWDEESFFAFESTSSTAIARTPKTRFARFVDPRGGPPSPAGEGLRDVVGCTV